MLSDTKLTMPTIPRDSSPLREPSPKRVSKSGVEGANARSPGAAESFTQNIPLTLSPAREIKGAASTDMGRSKKPLTPVNQPTSAGAQSASDGWESVTAIYRESVTAIFRESVTAIYRESVTAIYRESVTAIYRESETAIYRESVTAIYRESVTAIYEASVTAIYRESVTAIYRESVTAIYREMRNRPRLNGMIMACYKDLSTKALCHRENLEMLIATNIYQVPVGS
ncbi:hypothetical protein DPMN_147764 [Dreissena polymorpha]|uniref:Uncharacterized protein n=1 Tax=Dreissena polymorpha TaxID=45954 RepID=A0A9D4FB69_DREPO|nr:hypothetical protein DPMN_147764 [Dreissena polymorpha]